MKKTEVKNIISKLVIYAGFFTGLMTLSGTAKEMKLKRDAKEAFLTSKIEYYEQLIKINNEYLKAEKQNYEAKLKEYKENIVKETYSEIVKVDEEYKQQIINQLGTNNSDYKKYDIITQNDLEKVKKLSLNITENSDIEFLKYCNNLEELEIFISENQTEKLENLPFMLNLKTLKLSLNSRTFSVKEAKIITFTMPNLEELILPIPTSYRLNTIEEVARATKLKKLLINPSRNCDIDFKKICSLGEITINSTNPYDIAIWFNSDEYNFLKDNNVKIIFLEDTEEEYLNVSSQLDEIIKKLPISKNSTDEEILDTILEYVIKNFKTNPKEEINENTYRYYKHYINGILYGAFECDTQISGNYAGIIEAIYDRIDTPSKSYILENKEGYMWNLINVGGKDYYIDGVNLTLQKKDEEGNLVGKQQVEVYSKKTNEQYIAVNIPKDTYEMVDLIEKKYQATEPVKSIEIPNLNIQPIQPSNQHLDIEMKQKVKEYDKNIVVTSITGIVEITVALYALLKRKYKNQIREIKGYIKHL